MVDERSPLRKHSAYLLRDRTDNSVDIGDCGVPVRVGETISA